MKNKENTCKENKLVEAEDREGRRTWKKLAEFIVREGEEEELTWHSIYAKIIETAEVLGESRPGIYLEKES